MIDEYCEKSLSGNDYKILNEYVCFSDSERERANECVLRVQTAAVRVGVLVSNSYQLGSSARHFHVIHANVQALVVLFGVTSTHVYGGKRFATTSVRIISLTF